MRLSATGELKYDGVTVNELKRMKEIEAENAKLKRMYADLALEKRCDTTTSCPESCNSVREAAGRRVVRERANSCQSSAPAASWDCPGRRTTEPRPTLRRTMPR